MNPAMQQNRNGFTMIEIIAVLALLAILAAMAIQSIARSTAPLMSEANQLAQSLRYTQTRALSDVRPWLFEIVGVDQYRLGPDGGPWERIPASSVTVHQMGNGVAAAPTGTIRFDTWGRPVAIDGTPLAAVTVITLNDGTTNTAVTITPGTGLIQ